MLSSSAIIGAALTGACGRARRDGGLDPLQVAVAQRQIARAEGRPPATGWRRRARRSRSPISTASGCTRGARPGRPTPTCSSLAWRRPGATVEPLESRVTGGGEPPELQTTGAIALMPPGWPPGAGNVQVALAEEITLPLLVLWLAGARPPALLRLLAGMASP